MQSPLPRPEPRPGPALAARQRGLWHSLAVWWDLFLIRLQDVREEWHWLVIGWFVFPVGILVFLRAATAGEREMAAYVVTGNAVVALVLNSVQQLSSSLAWSRQRHDLDYYTTLPISRLQLVLAYVAQAMLLSVPGALVNLAVGALVFHLTLTVAPWVLAAIALMVLSMSGIGVAIGITARTGTEANVINNLVLVVTMFLSPVMVPASRLPAFLRYASALLPTTYAAHALRAAMDLVPHTPQSLFLDLAVLGVWAAGTLYLALTRMEWRRD